MLLSAGACNDESDSMSDAPQQPMVYSQGKELQDLSMTVREAGLLSGQSLSLHARWACLDKSKLHGKQDVARAFLDCSIPYMMQMRDATDSLASNLARVGSQAAHVSVS